MAQEPEVRIAALREQLEKARQLRYRSEARLEELERQRERILSDLTALGVDPADLDREIERLRAEAQGLLDRAAALLPGEGPARASGRG